MTRSSLWSARVAADVHLVKCVDGDELVLSSDVGSGILLVVVGEGVGGEELLVVGDEGGGGGKLLGDFVLDPSFTCSLLGVHN
jgi:hypothetical protein